MYASESLALCLAECLVHVPGRLPSDYTAYELEMPSGSVEVVEGGDLKAGWMADIGYTRAIGDQWIEQCRTLALLVPSAVLPASTNILINAGHPGAGSIRVMDRGPFAFDPRLRP